MSEKGGKKLGAVATAAAAVAAASGPIGWTVLGIAALGVGAAAIYNSRDSKTKNEKTLAILGGVGVGKTTLHIFLNEGEIRPTEATSLEKEMKPFTLDVKGRRIKFNPGRDIAGDNDTIRDIWEEELKKDVCIYMLDASKLNEQEYLDSLFSQFDKISEKKDKIIFFANLCDKLSYLDDENVNFIYTKMQEVTKGNVSRRNIVLGSLTDLESAEKIKRDLIEILEIKLS